MAGYGVRTLVRLLFFTLLVLEGSRAQARPRGHSLTGGEASEEGAFLSAGESGADYVLTGGARAHFDSGTLFSFQAAMQLKLGAPNEPKTETQVINVIAGRVNVEVREKSGTAVLVRGPRQLSVLNKGGRSVYLAKSGSSVAASLGGDMLYGIGNRFRPLASERLILTRGGANNPETQAIVGQPNVTVDRSLLLAVDGLAEAHVKWQPLPGAASYAVLLDRTGSPAGFRKLQTREPHALLGELPPGHYTVSTVAIDSNGIEGRPSTSASLRVFGLRVPEGARRTADGCIVLDKNQRIPLVAAEGLELTYNSSTHFMPAPRAVGLSRNEQTLVRVRIPGTVQEEKIHLQPEGLKAKVVLGPNRARWPLDPVRITVSLFDLNGRVVPSDAQVSIRVTVNLKPVTLSWQRAGNVLSATLEPQRGNGPWVVRAEVLDRKSTSVGRGFLEVIHTSPSERRAAQSSVAGLGEFAVGR